ncbi:TPA: succinate--CoA ligase subunit alpha [Candidatus Saccharibacteria bacterium]|nr:succinate--CoA ligase subunit alpha [Candidatus Saccharibacteria bacterium]HRK40613.1 succinate--CoA ligase subunit alpha [Candidatus Saccharibacteria bacterium]
MTLFDKPTVLVQGITGHHGAFHTKGMVEAGTNIVAGVTPGKGGQEVHGLPVFSSVSDAKSAFPDLNTSVVFVPAAFAKNAVVEVVDAGIEQIVVITEGIPVHDALFMHEYCTSHDVTLVGPNCPGLIVPGSHKLGIIAAHITSPGSTAIISRSGTLTYELADALTKKGIGQSIILGIGGDPVPGMSFVDALKMVEANTQTEQIIMVGEIGGTTEQLAADYIAEHVSKPVHGLIVGHAAPAGQTFGHAGAIVGTDSESASAKTEYLRQKGIQMSATLDELISQL